MKGFLAWVLVSILMIILVETRHCSSMAAGSWDWAINSEMNNNMTTTTTTTTTAAASTSTYDCTASIHDCIAPEAEFLMDHSFGRMLATGPQSGIIGTKPLKVDPVCPTDVNGRTLCGQPGNRSSTQQICNIYNRDNRACPTQ